MWRFSLVTLLAATACKTSIVGPIDDVVDTDTDVDTDSESDSDTDTDSDTWDPNDLDRDGVPTPEDCDDTDPTVYPGAEDIENDAIDQDCDGRDAGAVLSVGDLVVGDLTITEIMKNPEVVEDTVGEWFEIQNTSENPINLLDLRVSDRGSPAQTFTVSISLILDPGGFAVFGVSANPAYNGGVPVDFQFTGFSLSNDGDAVVLANATDELDEVFYDDLNFPDVKGRSMQLPPDLVDPTLNDEGSSWCNATSEYGNGDYGTPGVENDGCVADADVDGWADAEDCDDVDPTIHPGALDPEGDGIDQNCDGIDGVAIVDADGDGYLSDVDCDDTDTTVYPGATETPDDGIDQDCDGKDTTLSTATPVSDLVAGDLVISEVMPDPALTGTDTSHEWFEVYNATTGTVNLADLTIGDNSKTFTVSGKLEVAAGDVAVFAAVADSTLNGGNTEVDYAYGTSSIVFANSGDELTLSVVDAATGTSTIIDTVVWAKGDSAWSWISAGYTMSLSGDTLDATSNDSGVAWCDAATAYGSDGNYGSPGTINDECMVDADGDGFYAGTADGDDCDDTDDTINPDATEVIGDGIDQNCDGSDGEIALDDVLEGELIVTEVMIDPSKVLDKYGEWFELFNASGYPVDLDGLSYEDTDGVTFSVSTKTVVASGEYVVLGIDDDDTLNGGVTVDYDYDGPSFDESGSAFIFVLTNADGTVTFDEVGWETGWPWASGVSMSLSPALVDATSNDDVDSWCEATSTYGDGDYGTPGDKNDSCSSTGVTLTVSDLGTGDLVITEIMPDAAASGTDTTYEWFEVYNNSGSEVDLENLVVADNSTSFTVSGSLVVADGDYVVFAAENDSTLNGGNTAVDYEYGTKSIALANGGDQVTLKYTDASGTSTTFDEVKFSTSGTTKWPYAAGYALSLDPDYTDATSNDTSTSWCKAASKYGTSDYGTPGSKNDEC